MGISFAFSNFYFTFAPDGESKNGWWLVIGWSLMQIIAEQGD
jgi:hypothetical protein